MPLAKTGSRAKFRHKRIASPKAFDPRSFRTKKVGKSRVIIGCPKGKYSPSTGRCKVGTKAQAVLRPKRTRNAVVEIQKKDILDAIERRDPVERALSGHERFIKKYGIENVFRTAGDIRMLMDDELDPLVKGLDRETPITIISSRNPTGRKKNPIGARNPRKLWYYGPSITHRGKVLVFPSARTPTKATHGRKVKYAVGPFKTSDEASRKARYAKMGMTGRSTKKDDLIPLHWREAARRRARV